MIGRPDAAICERFASFPDQVKGIAPAEHFCQSNELHLTILSLRTATDAFEPHWNNRAAYQAAVDQALHVAQPFKVHYRGITASNSAIFIQGFAHGSQLNQLRTRLRLGLRDAGAGSGLDHRSAIKTAHSTVIRFISQPSDMPGPLALLRDNRTRDLGTAVYQELLLAKNDWYMSDDQLELLTRCPLAVGPWFVQLAMLP